MSCRRRAKGEEEEEERECIEESDKKMKQIIRVNVIEL